MGKGGQLPGFKRQRRPVYHRFQFAPALLRACDLHRRPLCGDQDQHAILQGISAVQRGAHRQKAGQHAGGNPLIYPSWWISRRPHRRLRRRCRLPHRKRHLFIGHPPRHRTTSQHTKHRTFGARGEVCVRQHRQHLLRQERGRLLQEQRKVDLNTVYNYLSALESAYIIRKIPRYDIKGKEILQTNEKYYIGDQSLAYAVMGYKDRMIAGILENIVMLELERRGYRVCVGKLNTKEIDFIAERKNEKVYVQVSYTPTVSQETVDREFSPLLAVKDHYPKYVVTMDDFWRDNVEGVKHKHLAEFLLMDEY
ncbi:MAG: DUF4143 domain-containing protein [Bacillota bacterium]